MRDRMNAGKEERGNGHCLRERKRRGGPPQSVLHGKKKNRRTW